MRLLALFLVCTFIQTNHVFAIECPTGRHQLTIRGSEVTDCVICSASMCSPYGTCVESAADFAVVEGTSKSLLGSRSKRYSNIQTTCACLDGWRGSFCDVRVSDGENATLLDHDPPSARHAVINFPTDGICGDHAINHMNTGFHSYSIDHDKPLFQCHCAFGWAGNKCQTCQAGFVGENCEPCSACPRELQAQCVIAESRLTAISKTRSGTYYKCQGQ